MNPLEELIWHTKYARKTQIERLNEHLEEDPTNTIGNFLHKNSEWQLDSLIRYNLRLLSQIKKDQEKKPNKLLFWKK